jgi:predicted flap endonuclease-1-like 5' DNA nuclease
MFVFLLQAVLLLAIAYILGAIAGCLLRTQFNERPEHSAAHKPASQPAPQTKEPAPSVASEATKPAAATEAAMPAAKRTIKAKAPAKKPAAPKAAGKVATKSAPAARTVSEKAGTDDLKRIRGVGRQIEAKLNAAGIARYDQIAKWTKKDVAEWGEKLSFAGRIEREEWVAQAKKLAKGEMTDFAKRVSKGEVATSKACDEARGAKQG